MITGLKHQKEKSSMDHFAGLDVSVKDTSGRGESRSAHRDISLHRRIWSLL